MAGAAEVRKLCRPPQAHAKESCLAVEQIKQHRTHMPTSCRQDAQTLHSSRGQQTFCQSWRVVCAPSTMALALAERHAAWQGNVDILQTLARASQEKELIACYWQINGILPCLEAASPHSHFSVHTHSALRLQVFTRSSFQVCTHSKLRTSNCVSAVYHVISVQVCRFLL